MKPGPGTLSVPRPIAWVAVPPGDAIPAKNVYTGLMRALQFLRKDMFDPKSMFIPSQKPEFRQNEFGGSLGGPIKKDKIFVFRAYEQLRTIQGQVNPNGSGIIPTPQRTGVGAMTPQTHPQRRQLPVQAVPRGPGLLRAIARQHLSYAPNCEQTQGGWEGRPKKELRRRRRQRRLQSCRHRYPSQQKPFSYRTDCPFARGSALHSRRVTHATRNEGRSFFLPRRPALDTVRPW